MPTTSLSAERAVRSLTAPRPTPQQQQNGAIDHSRQVQAHMRRRALCPKRSRNGFDISNLSAWWGDKKLPDVTA